MKSSLKMELKVLKVMKMNDTEKRWVKYAQEHLTGKTIVSVRYLTKEEAKGMYWTAQCLVITLNDGTVLFPSRDDEGNGAGTMFGRTSKNGGADLTFPVLQIYD